jgi:hypothetical protein
MYLAHHKDGDFLPGIRKIQTRAQEWEEARGEVETTVRAVRGVLGWIVDVCRHHSDTEGIAVIGHGEGIRAYSLRSGTIAKLSHQVVEGFSKR